jgi:uncharacterized phiE125 gp8 family phage protein
MANKLLTGPAVEPVLVAEAKSHMRVDISDDDTLITGLLLAAKEHVEDITGCKCISQKWQLVLDRFTREEATYTFFNRTFVPSVFDIAANHLTPDKTRIIRIPFAPLASVDKFEVTDQNGTTTEFAAASFIADVVGIPGRIVLKEAYDWPYPAADLASANAVAISYTVGYGASGASVPERIKLAIKMLASHWYENREAQSPLGLHEVPMGVRALLANFRVFDREEEPR